MKGKFDVVGILDGWKPGDLPGNQMVSVILNEFVTGRNGEIHITQQLASNDEVDYVINQLLADLEAVRKKAKAKIKNTNERIRASLEDK